MYMVIRYIYIYIYSSVPNMDLSQIRGCTDMAMKKWGNDDYEIQMCSHVLRHPYSGSYIMFWTGYEPLKESS